VLNNNARISEDTRKKVLDAVSRMGYHPDSHARGLAAKYTRVISVVLPPLSHVFADAYFGEVISGIYDHAQETGHKLLLDVANERFVREREYINLLHSRRADGVLFVGSTVGNTYLLDFLDTGYPCLLVNNFFEQGALNHVVADYPASARLAAEHLVALGHRKIGLIRGELVQTGDCFHQNFIAQCVRLGCALQDIPIGVGHFSEASGQAAAEILLRTRPDITAIVAGNDRMALGAIQAAWSMGRRIPEDLSIIGVDDIPQAAGSRPALTTVRHDLYTLGRVAAEGIMTLVRKECTAIHRVMPVELVVRETTGPTA